VDHDQQALLATIVANPDLDAPRLVYADWLDEHCEPGKPGWPANGFGWSAQAELIRVQCEILRGQGSGGEPLQPDERARLEGRDRTLKQTLIQALGPEINGLADLSERVSFDRGFLNLILRGTPITALPDNLTVGGNLNLNRTPITTLPDNLTVSGNLHLWGTNITMLPDNLTVGGNLHLRGTLITTLPDNLHVDGGLFHSGQLSAELIHSHPGLSVTAKRSGLESAGYSLSEANRMLSRPTPNPSGVAAESGIIGRVVDWLQRR
jgi:uncharacterized protein (TIGR02996 family)